ncbi:hypothetical protein AAMO2058_001046200 [Amorphochlora amoebiformis]|eukprot:1149141-Amorphochlora_amoeboformis.AAC.1
MFRAAARLIARPAVRPVARKFGHYIPPGDTRAVWLSDKGAYPIIMVISCAATLMLGGLYRLTTQAPQLTWIKERRGMPISEGTHESVENAKSYYNNPLRRIGKRRYKELLD